MNALVRSERGAVVIWFLLFLPLLLMSTVYIVTQGQAVTGADVDLQGALNTAARAAAMQVSPESQAGGLPRIDAAKAHAAFRTYLAQNLGLSADLSPLSGSLLAETPDYELVIYNGDGSFGHYPAYKFSFKNGTLSSGPMPLSGLPKDFTISAGSISAGLGGEQEVTLDRPGVVAVISTKQGQITGNEPLAITRWIAAKIVY